MGKIRVNQKEKLQYVGKKAGEYGFQAFKETYSTIDEESVISYAAKSANIPESAMRAAALAYVEAVNYFVCNGHSVKIKKFGTLGLRIKAKSVSEAEDVKPGIITMKSISYFPSVELKEAVQSVKLETRTYDREGEQI